MTWTYSSTDLSTDLAKIRRFVGDVDSSDPLLTDEEIDYAQDAGGTIRGAAALCAEFISALYARRADKSVGDLSISASQKSKQYADLAARLRRENVSLALPYFGGISIAAKDAREADTDRVKPAFTMTMLDDPAADGSDNEGDT